jgi:hypothetical protein
MKVKENHYELELNGTHQIMVYADDVNIQDENTDTVWKDMKSLLET